MFYENLRAIKHIKYNIKNLNKHGHKISLRYKADFYNKIVFIEIVKNKYIDCNSYHAYSLLYYYRKGYKIICSSLYELI